MTLSMAIDKYVGHDYVIVLLYDDGDAVGKHAGIECRVSTVVGTISRDVDPSLSQQPLLVRRGRPRRAARRSLASKVPLSTWPRDLEPGATPPGFP